MPRRWRGREVVAHDRGGQAMKILPGGWVVLVALAVVAASPLAAQEPPRSPRPRGSGRAGDTTGVPVGVPGSRGASESRDASSWSCGCDERRSDETIVLLESDPERFSKMAEAIRELAWVLGEFRTKVEGLQGEVDSAQQEVETYLRSKRDDSSRRRFVDRVERCSQSMGKQIQAIDIARAQLVGRFERPNLAFPSRVRNHLSRMAPALRDAMAPPTIPRFVEPDGLSDDEKVRAAIGFVGELVELVPGRVADRVEKIEIVEDLVARLESHLVFAWAWLDVLDLELVPGQITAERRVTQDPGLRMERWRRFICDLDELVSQWPASIDRWGPEPFWIEMVSDALPREDRRKRAEMPDLRERYLKLAGRVDPGDRDRATPLRRATIQSNIRLRLGAWFEDRLAAIDIRSDPELKRRWTCLQDLANRWREGEGLR